MKTFLTLAALTAALSLGGTAVRADSTSAHGFNVGSGNPQNTFTVVTNNGIELGLDAQPRYTGPAVTDDGVGDYSVQPGAAAPAGHANGLLWNFDYSIDTSPTNAGTLNLSDLVATLSVSGLATGSFNPITQIGDNSPSGSTTLAQNSENLLFFLPVNPNARGTYTFTLTVNNKSTGALLATDAINVNVVPLPSAAGMGVTMLGLIGGAALLRKKLRTA